MYTAVARVKGGGVLEVFTEWGMKATNGSTVNSGSWLRASVEAGLRPTQVIPLVPLRLLTIIGRGTLCSRSEAGCLQTAVVTATLPALSDPCSNSHPVKHQKDPLKLQLRQSAFSTVHLQMMMLCA